MRSNCTVITGSRNWPRRRDETPGGGPGLRFQGLCHNGAPTTYAEHGQRRSVAGGMTPRHMSGSRTVVQNDHLTTWSARAQGEMHSPSFPLRRTAGDTALDVGDGIQTPPTCPDVQCPPITPPSLPFLVNLLQGTGSRGASPLGNISHAQRMFLGQRRASSAQPVPSHAWTLDMYPSASDSGLEAWQLQRDWSPLPAVDMSLFEPEYVQNGGQGTFECPSEDGSDLFQVFPQFLQALMQPTRLTLSISPLDAIPPHAHLSPFSESSTISASTAYSYSSDETLMPR